MQDNSSRWSVPQRARALDACEAHRWETGHVRAVLRRFGGGFTGGVVTETAEY